MVNDATSLGICILIIIVAIVGLVVAVAILILKLKKVNSRLLTGYAAVAATTAKLPITDARELDPFRPKPVIKPTIPPTQMLTLPDFYFVQLCFWIAASIVLGSCILVLSRKLYQGFKELRNYTSQDVEQSKYRSRITLKLSKGLQVVTLVLLDLPFPISSVSAVDCPELQDLRKVIRGWSLFSKMSLTLVWSKTLTFKANGSVKEISLPTRIIVPFTLTRKMMTLIQEDEIRLIESELFIDTDPPSKLGNLTTQHYSRILWNQDSSDHLVTKSPSDTGKLVTFK